MAQSEDAGPCDPLTLADQLWERLHELADRGDWGARKYANDGSVRDTTPLSPQSRRKAKIIIDAIEAAPKMCWKNAQTAALVDGDWCSYFEGYVQFSDLSIPIEHAWVEADGRVVELTFKEAPATPEDTVYIGVEYEFDRIQSMWDESGQCSAVAKFEGRRRCVRR